MKRFLTMMLMVALAAMMSGCIQMHMNTEIEKDGSGTMEMTMSLSAVVTEAINEMGTEGMDDDMEEIGDLMKMEKSELEESIKDLDVELVKFEQGIVEERETVQIKLKFKDLENLSLALRSIMGGEDNGLAIVDNGDGNFVLRPYEYDWPPLPEEEVEADEAEDTEEVDPEEMQKQMALMGKLMGAMGELDISMKMTVPGDIIESNAPTVEGRTSIWTINSSNMMSGNTDMEPNIVFSGEGLKIKPVK